MVVSRLKGLEFYGSFLGVPNFLYGNLRVPTPQRQTRKKCRFIKGLLRDNDG